jgi:regulator of sigma E protease
MSVLIFFVILLVLVIVHEFGHYIAAKKNGILVEEFGFGFPPRLFAKKIGETLFSFNLIPLGGFVKVFGEEYNELKSDKKAKLKHRAFAFKKPWQKAMVVVAGVIFNFLLGWLLISYLFTQGVPTPTNKVIIEQIAPGSPAERAALTPHDSLIMLKKDGKDYPLTTSGDLITLSRKFAGEPIVLTVERGDRKFDVTVTPRKTPPQGQGPLGIAITSFTEKKYPWYQAPFFGLIEAFNITKTILVELVKALVQLVTLQKPNVDVTGPVGIAQFTGQAVKLGNNAVLELMALLSLNLAVLNILPFPALDGGKLMLIIYEWITRKRVNATLERMLNIIGFVLLLSIAAAITINDIIKLYR